MNIKKFVKEHAPKSLLPFMGFSNQIARAALTRKSPPLTEARIHDIQARAEEYLPYYQDELYRLSNITGIVLIYDNEGTDFTYLRRALASIDWTGSCRLMTLNEFLHDANVSDSELIVTSLSKWGKLRFAARYAAKNLKADVFFGLFILIREDLQYFDVFSPVDAGAYDGATAIQFLKWGKGKVKHVYSFEFDPKNAAKCEDNLKPYADKVTLIKKGTWDKDEVIQVAASRSSGSNVKTEGNTEAQLTVIDNIVKNERVTFIKMDVEGAELKSLMGARNTIIKNHPRLAICVYHKASDLYKIPGYILSIVPEYKLRRFRDRTLRVL